MRSLNRGRATLPRRLPSHKVRAAQQHRPTLTLLIFLSLALPLVAAPAKIATPDEALASKEDLWGIAAMQQPDGPSYEFFRDLLPPLRYVNAAFRHYPIVLSAPGSLHKPRLTSNGSAINARAKLGTWRETGTCVSFGVGTDASPFGNDLNHLQGPVYQSGYLPIVLLDYSRNDTTYHQETFACTDAPFSDHAVLCSEFSLNHGGNGTITASFETNLVLHVLNQTIRNEKGEILIWFDKHWQWNAAKKQLIAPLAKRTKATLAVVSIPLRATDASAFNHFNVEKQKRACINTWENILREAAVVGLPEPIVNNAWKSVVIGSFMLLKGDDMNYSAGNAYECMYEAECGDNVRALMTWGLEGRAKKMIPPLLDYGVNPGLRFHDAAFKLQLLCHYYWVTRDADFIREQKPRWLRFVEILTKERDAKNGLLPAEDYCGDIHEKVFSSNSNANGWRGLRDIATVLEAINEHGEAQRILATANRLRKATFDAIEKSTRRDVNPPFIPLAMFGAEKPYDVLTTTMLGSYWDLMIPFVIGAQIFDPGAPQEKWMLRYLEQHGGICMGMIRFHQHSGLFANEDGLDDCFGLRYTDALLRRDETDRALVSFYGKLAQGMTRDTFLSAEGTGLRSLDKFGRPMYLPPTCTGIAFFLTTLRSMLVQDYDLDNDGEPETLRLLYATPKRWLEDGKSIHMERMPTAFGEISIEVKSRLRHGEVVAEVNLPKREMPKQTLLRIRLPDGWTVQSARVGKQKLVVDKSGAVDISTLHGEQTIRFSVAAAH